MNPIFAAVASDPGRVRSRNEDAVCWDPQLRCAIVLDGMGGHAGGSEASRVGLEAAIAALREEATGSAALRAAHLAIVACAEEHPEWKGMGATGVLARIGDDVVDVAWVGDSRAYLFRGGALSPLTRDHSFVESLVVRGDLTREEARRHPQRNVVTRSLGIGDPEPAAARVRLQPGDAVLLCSDGLTDELPDEQIAEFLAAGGTLRRRVDQLVERANAAGGRDNVTVALIEAPGDPSRSETLRAVALGTFAALVVGGLVWGLKTFL
ncbi:MAG: protein phosphatase 2C domain-containing protein [Pseudomonadales bacterium]|nr:protein phosphatase 2C domain-containing protein [Pseudomonadales bacterium]